jgi:hypothetical protein
MPAPRSHHKEAEPEGATRSRHVARCAKAPVGSPAGALLYLMPRSLGAACVYSPSVTLCEPGSAPLAHRTIALHKHFECFCVRRPCTVACSKCCPSFLTLPGLSVSFVGPALLDLGEYLLKLGIPMEWEEVQIFPQVLVVFK